MPRKASRKLRILIAATASTIAWSRQNDGRSPPRQRAEALAGMSFSAAMIAGNSASMALSHWCRRTRVTLNASVVSVS